MLAEDDGEEEIKPIHVVPERLATLEIRTGFSRDEICKIYRAFKQHCPGGAATPNDLRPAYAKLFPLGDSTKYAQVVFNTFDTNKDGLVSFGDFLTGLALIVKGNPEEKLSWIFGWVFVTRFRVDYLSAVGFIQVILLKKVGATSFSSIQNTKVLDKRRKEN